MGAGGKGGGRGAALSPAQPSLTHSGTPTGVPHTQLTSALRPAPTHLLPVQWSGVDWRQKLENQRGAVLATELKNNASKIAKWTAAALVGWVRLPAACLPACLLAL